MNRVGIDAVSFYVPKLYVSMGSIAKARNISIEKLKKGLGLKKMAIPDHGEDTVSFAANALLNLVVQNEINPREVGRVYLGTESAVDASKPTATYALDLVEEEMVAKYGERCFKNCDVLDMTFACVAAVDALQNCVDWVSQNEQRKAIVIASDVSKYEMNSSGEYTQGAGAVALLIAHHPSIIQINSTWGIGFKNEGDFFKPRRTYTKIELLKTAIEGFGLKVGKETLTAFLKSTSSEFWSDKNEMVEVYKEEPVFDGQFSNQCYSERVSEALSHFSSQSTVCFLNDWDAIVFHLPYAFHGRRVIFDNWLSWIKDTEQMKSLEAEIGLYENGIAWRKKAYKSKYYSQFVREKIAPGERASSEIGNMYTASTFMSLLSMLSTHYNLKNEISGNRIGLIGYGSGSKAKIFEGIVQSGWKEKLKQLRLFETLDRRVPVDVETYEKLHTKTIRKPVANKNGFTLDRVENETNNYGLRRYKQHQNGR